MRSWLLLATMLAACGEAETAEAPPELVAPAEPPATSEGEDDGEDEALTAETEAEADEPAPVVPSTHELLVLLVSEQPLLRSEERLGEFLEARMRRNRRDAELRPATEAEAAFARDGGALPETFGAAERLLVLHVAEPRTLPDGDLRSRGLDGVALYRLPGATPVFQAQMDDGWRLEDEQWATWIAGLLREGEGT